MPSARVWIDATQEDELQSLEFLDEWGDLRRVCVHDVGQGNGNALLVHPQDEPVLYFDVGCGALWNKRTLPQQLGYDFTERPWIILSHWDFDHWWAGFNDEWNDAQHCEWLAPRQKISPMHQRLASELDDNLRLWPNSDSGHFRESISAITGDDTVHISRCRGAADGDRNDSGLAITIEKERLDDNDMMATPDLVLLPGDAPYNYIPRPVLGDWVGIVATHHGSRTNLLDGNGQPIAAVPTAYEVECPVIVYSAGPGNVYGHPNQDAVDAYGEKKWQTKLDTDQINGHFCLRYDTAATAQQRGDQEISFEFE